MRAVLIGPNGHRSCLQELKATFQLKTVAHFPEPGTALSFVQAGVDAPTALVVDASHLPDPNADRDLVALLDATMLQWPDCRVAAVLGEAQRYLSGDLQHANTRLFLPGQVDDDSVELIGDLAAYLGLSRRRGIQAPIVLALSAKGGVGKTSLIANLGAALAVRHGLRVAVVDGDLTRGDLARLLGAEPALTLLDLVADGSPGGISAALDRYLVPLLDGRLCLLAAPNGGQSGAQPWMALTVRHARAILQALTERFDVVLLDSPPDLQRSSPFPAAALSDGTLPFVALVVVQPQPLEREGAKQVLDLLASQPAEHGEVQGVVINRSPAAGNTGHLASLLGVEIIASIPYDPKIATARQATDLLYDFDRKRLRPVARAYDRLAVRIAEGGGA